MQRDRATVPQLAGILWLAALSVLASRGVALAQTEEEATVLLLADAPRQGLVDALKIHLSPVARLRVAGAPRATSTAARVRLAQQTLAAERRGTLAMWLEEDRHEGTEREVLVYLVSRRRGRALVEIVRVRGGAEEELDRAVALKAREVLDAVTRARDELATTLAPAGEAPRQPAIDAVMVLELDVFGATSSGTASPQLAGQLIAGFALEGDAWLFDVVAFVRIPTPLARESAEGVIDATEVAAGGAARALWVADRFAVGGFVEGGARMLSAEGTTALGTPGAAERIVPFWSTGPELRVTLVDWLRARTALGVEIALVRQRFALNGVALVDLGPVRGTAEIGLVANVF